MSMHLTRLIALSIVAVIYITMLIIEATFTYKETWEIKFRWYDIWVGFYWDRKNKWLYICPFPCIAVVIKFDTWLDW